VRRQPRAALVRVALAATLCGCAPVVAAPGGGAPPATAAPGGSARPATAAPGGGAPPATAAPGGSARPGTASGKLATANRTHEYPTPIPHQRARAVGDPLIAVAAFAEVYINWDASNLAKRLAALAAASVGQARSAMQLAAAEASRDYELRRGGIANRGTVEAVAPVIGRRDRFVVVTRESSTSSTGAYAGLAPAWHLALAAVSRQGGGWVVSAWQPEG
jgi:hypothetical protein